MDKLVLDIPVIIKAKTEANGRRLVEVECSNESVDTEGDVILQSALLDSAESFIATGHLDIDHISEIGHRYGIKNPTSYIVGRPTEVKDIGGKRTSVVGEIMRAKDGSFNPAKNKYDEFWQSLTSDPPVLWRASIFGFPTADGLVDCSKSRREPCFGATRWLVKGIQWRSLAFTRNPINDAIATTARVLTEKAFMTIMKSYIDENYIDKNYNMSPASQVPLNNGPAMQTPLATSNMNPADIGQPGMLAPRNREEIMGHWHAHIQKGNCPFAGSEIGNSIWSFRDHFSQCCGLPSEGADILALALMQLLKREKR